LTRFAFPQVPPRKDCAEAASDYQKISLFMQPSGGRALLADFAVSSEAHK